MLRITTTILAPLALVAAIAASSSASAQNCNSKPKNCRGLDKGSQDLRDCLLWNGRIQDACNKAGNDKKTEDVGNLDSAESDRPAPPRRK
jgi:hypothetical protein